MKPTGKFRTLALCGELESDWRISENDGDWTKMENVCGWRVSEKDGDWTEMENDGDWRILENDGDWRTEFG